MSGLNILLYFLTLFGLTWGADEVSFSMMPSISYSNLVGSRVLLNQQAFGNSWNSPSNTPYDPTITDFNRVVLELKVTSTGVNYDRLCQLFVDNIEIWRTSTAEPDSAGTTWTVKKDVPVYANLFKEHHNINFLIKNRVTNEYTGVFFVTLTAHFYNDTVSEPESDAGWVLDLDNLPTNIQGLSKASNKAAQSWSAPDDDIAVNIGPLDRSVNRAVVHVFASGNGDDEFWWDEKSSANGAGPSRFVDVYVDNELAGFGAPYPVIYTGGVSPYLWKPLVDIHAFDIPAHFIDVTPFLPKLWDASTSISINITNGLDTEKVPSNWFVSYNLLLWSTNGQSNSGTYKSSKFIGGKPAGSSAEDAVLVQRTIKTSASLNIGGEQRDVQWEQAVDYNNTRSGNNHVWQNTLGTSSITGLYDFNVSYSYPFQCETNKNYYRVQQTYNTSTHQDNFMTWIDSSVWFNDDGSYAKSLSRQFYQLPGTAHYARTENMTLVSDW